VDLYQKRSEWIWKTKHNSWVRRSTSYPSPLLFVIVILKHYLSYYFSHWISHCNLHYLHMDRCQNKQAFKRYAENFPEVQHAVQQSQQSSRPPATIARLIHSNKSPEKLHHELMKKMQPGMFFVCLNFMFYYFIIIILLFICVCFKLYL